MPTKTTVRRGATRPPADPAEMTYDEMVELVTRLQDELDDLRSDYDNHTHDISSLNGSTEGPDTY